MFSVLAVASIAIVLAGGRVKSKQMIVLGVILCAPLVLGGVVMFAAGIVALAIDRRKNRKKSNE
ncbi:MULTISPECIES: hypothetical protein [Sorangium]|uniref:hypothetical protein n=1 Tax=Sorangium TaxID=39643 RepID=UPI00101A2D12|nr:MULTISPECIES: hypothetical protein [Sorangium]